MKRVGLIAVNVVREQRWFLLLMFGYIAGITTLMSLVERREEDVLLVFKQEAIYGTFFSVVIAASLIQGERKTRRIIAVLSKAISRREYLAGAIGGVNLATAVFYGAVFLSLFILFPRVPGGTALELLLHLMAASMLASVVTIFFTTFLHPLVATMATGLALASALLFERLGWHVSARALPVVALIKHALSFSPDGGLGLAPGALVLAVAECVALWLVASWIFGLRDITTTVE